MGNKKEGLKYEDIVKTRVPNIVAEILTNSDFHPRGIKVRLEDGQVGRVQSIL